MQNPPAEADPMLGLIVLGVVAAVIMFCLVRTGVFHERAFDAAPRRVGKLNLIDPLVAMVLLMAGQTIMLQWLPAIEAGAEMTASDMLIRLVGSQVGALPMLVYIFYRVQTAVDNELAGFGFAFARIPASLKYAGLGVVTVIPLTMAVSAAVVMILRGLGMEPDLIAHDALKVLTDEAWGPTRWGLILTAVVGAPIVEELLFRGFFQTSLLQSGYIRSPWTSIVIYSVLFTLVHASVAQSHAMPALFTLSLGLGYVYERTGSLFAPMLLHAAFNAIQITFALNLQTPAGP